MTLRLREMGSQDIEAVARLHAESWRSTYRGILRDEYLDGPVFQEHRSLWGERLSSPGPRNIGLIADDGADTVGFLFAMLDPQARWGTYLDNLHVSPRHRGRGVGTRLLRGLSKKLLEGWDDGGLHLWAFEDNVQTCRYYESLGAVALERTENEAPGGGEVAEWLYWWKTVAQLRDATSVR